MKLKSAIPLVFSSLLFCYSCRQTAVEPNRPFENKQKDELIEANKNLIKQTAFLIESYGKRQQWNLKETESGLWFGIYKKGIGKKASVGKFVTLKYTLSLLDGTLCYSSDSTGIKQFTIGSGKVETGLDEGVAMMRVGDVAHIILPPHLGYGLVGDGNCIPPHGVLVYEVTLVDVK
jgi:FKBP-type peptidyl-prolyl cis-trans isomerase